VLKHCREYVQRVLQLSQLTRAERQPADINRLAHDTVRFFQQSLGSHLSVTVDAPSEALISDVDENLVRNALFNLIHNASQVDPNGKVAVFVTSEQQEGRPGVSIAVSDDGPGFPPELADRLFTPFFTTQRGDGRRLSIAQLLPFCMAERSAPRTGPKAKQPLRSGFRQ
jgi:signal transduction histidine kinase